MAEVTFKRDNPGGSPAIYKVLLDGTEIGAVRKMESSTIQHGRHVSWRAEQLGVTRMTRGAAAGLLVEAWRRDHG